MRNIVTTLVFSGVLTYALAANAVVTSDPLSLSVNDQFFDADTQNPSFVTGERIGHGSATLDCTATSGTSCDLTKSFDRFFVDDTQQFPVESQIRIFLGSTPGEIVFNELITNNTQVVWTDFHWIVGSESGSVSIASIENFGPFTIFNQFVPEEASVEGGSLAPGESFSPIVTLNIAVETSLDMIQHPSNTGDPGNGGDTDIPEPGTLALFGLGLAGAGFVRRRRPAGR